MIVNHNKKKWKWDSVYFGSQVKGTVHQGGKPKHQEVETASPPHWHVCQCPCIYANAQLSFSSSGCPAHGTSPAHSLDGPSHIN